jgi:hypothetical protein
MTITYDKIATTTLSSTTNTVTFNSISGTYTDLVLIANVRKSGENGEAMFVTFNGDDGSNYSYTWLSGNGTSVNSYRVSNDNRIQVYNQTTTANIFTLNILNIQNYSNTTTRKTLIGRAGTDNLRVNGIVGLWRNTSAITSITLTPDFYLSPTWQVGSTFTIYGIKAE